MRHTHGKAGCLKVLRQLSAFLDDDLPVDICTVIRRHMGDCDHCEEFVQSLRSTIALCQHSTYQDLPARTKAQLRTQILKAAGRL